MSRDPLNYHLTGTLLLSDQNIRDDREDNLTHAFYIVAQRQNNEINI